MTYTDIPRHIVLERRRAKRDAKKAREAMTWTAHRGCGWNHRVPTTADPDSWTLARGTADRATGSWTEPDYWVVDPSKPYLFHNGKPLAPCPNVSALQANEAAAIPGGMRRKHLERRYRGMSWNDAVQHGMLVEK